jgi:hypothetical protein
LFAANGFADAVGRDFTPGAKAAESTRALQAAEKLDSYSGKRQGTTSVVPQMQQNKRRALAPEACLYEFNPFTGIGKRCYLRRTPLESTE